VREVGLWLGGVIGVMGAIMRMVKCGLWSVVGLGLWFELMVI
jgi:hypothetical protein